MDESQDLAVRYEGQGTPVLVVHGWTMAGFVEVNDWEPIFSTKSGYRRIYIDLPGMGQSPIGSCKDLDSMLESVSNFVERHILPTNFIPIGTSCGAYLARALAYKYCDAVDGLLLRVPLVEPVSAKRDIDAFVPAIVNPALQSTLSAADREKLGDIPVQTSEYIDIFRRRLEATCIPAVTASDAAALEPMRNDPDRYKLAAAMHTPERPFVRPTLIVTGRQDTDVGYRDAWSLLPCHPRATFAVLDRMNHDLPVDDTDQRLFVALVDNWLKRVEEVRRLRAPVALRTTTQALQARTPS